MSEITEKDIEKIIEDYLKNALPLFEKIGLKSISPLGEAVMFCRFGQEQYILTKKINLETLPVRILRRLPIYLIREFAVQVELDSLWYWAITHDIFHVCPDSANELQNWTMKGTLKTLISTFFVDKYIHKIREMVPKTIENLDSLIFFDNYCSDGLTIALFLCLPILEGLVRFALSSIIDPNGKITKTCSFIDAKGKSITWKQGNYISSLAQLLHSLEANAQNLLSKPELGIDLRDFRSELEKMYRISKTSDGWDFLYGLRCRLLHGKEIPECVSLITNLISLIGWHLADEQKISKGLQYLAERIKSSWHSEHRNRFLYPP